MSDEREPLHVAAFSGGKDSTAMVLAMLKHGIRIDHLLITPTGDELPELEDHWNHVAGLVGLPLTVPRGPSLDDVIRDQKALPNFRMRFCTRMVKIVPAIAWVRRQTRPVTMYIGLRADEPERKGIISADVDERYPLREWGYDLKGVWSIIDEAGIKIPRRTDCARCYHQRIGEWWQLWHDHPDIWADAERQELELGATFRTPGRDSWPVGLSELREAFESGRVPRSVQAQMRRQKFEAELGKTARRSSQLRMFDDHEDEDDAPDQCRVCSL